ncbi:MAG: sialidase family protein, partial [Ignavibacteriaceae bacterium]
MKNTFFLLAILFFACRFSAAAQQKELKKNSHMMRDFSSPQLKRPEHKIIFPDNKFYANNKLTNSPTNSFIKPSEFQEFPYQAPDISYYEVTPVALSNGNIMLFWASYDELDFKDDSLYCATSTDGGITWKDKKIILHSPFNSIYYLNGLQTYSGRIIICWTNYTNSAGLTNMTYSVNNGDSWSPVSSISSYYNIAWYPSVAQSLDSSLYLSYSRDVNERYNDIVYRISNDDGLTWGTEKILSDNQTAQNMGSIIPVNGSKLLAFYSRVDNDYGIVKRISYDGGDSWSAETTILDNPGNDDNVRVIRISSDTLYLLYWQWNEPFYDFYYMVSGDNGDTWNEPVQFTKYSGWDGYVSNLCLYHNKPFVAFASDRWQSVYNLPHVWYGSIGIAEDNNPPPAVLNSA